MPKHILTFVASVFVGLSIARAADAQTLSVNTDLVAPGTSVVATVTGPPGYAYAIAGSTVGAGLVVFGVPLRLGTDYTLLASGVIPASGSLTVAVTPPFVGTPLDRYYIQLAVSPNSTFNPLLASAG